MRSWPGRPGPLGATWDGEGVNFAVFSEHATGVELCLFDRDDHETGRVVLRERTNGVWHGYLPDARPGQRYGYRVYGPYDPHQGQRFNPSKLLIDPYARALTSTVRWDDTVFGYRIGHEDLEADDRDSAGAVPRCIVVDPAFTWGDDRKPQTPWNRTVIYECHVRGMTMRHPDVPVEHRGTFLALASDPILDHLTSLGVTAVELLPVHQFVSERALVERGLVNYWGYNSVAFFAPDVRYATAGEGEQVAQFKSMVKTLHRAGIEVILDVVYNHTGEGNHLGPTLSMRGTDNSAAYRLAEDPRYYADYTGTGNSVNTAHPRTLQLVMDSLRYWATEMHVDGFRFDLAPTLARNHEGAIDMMGAFIRVVLQDPVLAGVKLIAEPWDVGPDGYQLGAFGSGWAEWNGRYRDCVRRFWRGDPGQISELAYRLSGSSDIFGASGRGTYASVNFVTAHDGFTLHDLVTYEHKHNEANGENNADGADENYSRNWGAEGETESARIVGMRERMKRNILATLLFSQGVPMLLAGDEMGRTQRGNNNAYCQDNEISWVDWEVSAADRDLLEFTRTLIRTLRANPVLRRRAFFSGQPIPGAGVKDITWIRPDGTEMTDEDWGDERNHILGMLIDSRATDEVDARGRPVFGDTTLIVLNGGARSRVFALPKVEGAGVWVEEVNTARAGTRIVRGSALNLVAHSLILLRFGEPA